MRCWYRLVHNANTHSGQKAKAISVIAKRTHIAIFFSQCSGAGTNRNLRNCTCWQNAVISVIAKRTQIALSVSADSHVGTKRNLRNCTCWKRAEAISVIAKRTQIALSVSANSRGNIRHCQAHATYAIAHAGKAQRQYQSLPSARKLHSLSVQIYTLVPSVPYAIAPPPRANNWSTARSNFHLNQAQVGFAFAVKTITQLPDLVC